MTADWFSLLPEESTKQVFIGYALSGYSLSIEFTFNDRINKVLINSRCLVPECEAANPSVELPVWWPKDVDAKCFRPVVDIQEFDKSNKTCSNNTFVEILEECHEWIYDNDNSIVSEVRMFGT